MHDAVSLVVPLPEPRDVQLGLGYAGANGASPSDYIPGEPNAPHSCDGADETSPLRKLSTIFSESFGTSSGGK